MISSDSHHGLSAEPENSILFINGKIITLNDTDDICEALAVRGDRIEAVGDNQAVRDLAHAGSKIVDLRGGTLMPGFIDAHANVTGAAAAWKFIDLADPAVKSLKDVLDRLSEKASREKKGAWIVGHRYDRTHMKGETLDRSILDAVSKDHPIVIQALKEDVWILNSCALELAEIRKDSPDVLGGTVERGKELLPTGILRGAAGDRIKRFHPYSNREQWGDEVASFCSEQHVKKGLTTVHDLAACTKEQVQLYLQLVRKRRLPLRVRIVIRGFPLSEELWPIFLNSGLSTGFGDSWLKVGTFKLSIDGLSGARQAALYQPYVGEPWNYGHLYFDVNDLARRMAEIMGAGFQMTLHAIGDRGIDAALDVVEKALKICPVEDHRTRIEHCMLPNLGSLERMRDLKVVPVLQPALLYFNGDKHWESFGEDRMRQYIPLRSLMEAGMKVHISSDWISRDANPMLGIFASVRRITRNGREIYPEESISVMDALRLYTINGAYTTFEEGLLGSLEKGKLADLIVLDDDILSADPDRIKDIKVDMTVIGGKVVYDRTA